MSVTKRLGTSQQDVDTGVGVLDRAVAVLEAVENGAHSYTAIVESTGFTRSTTHRMVKALEAHGFLTVVGGLGYRLGPRLLRLAASAMREVPLRDLAHPVIEHLAATTGESAQLYIPDQLRRVCIDAVESQSELRTIVPIGASLPLTAGSAGRVFLAWGPAGARIQALERIERFTDETPDAARLSRDIDSTRRRGWAWSAGERQKGVGSVSAPVFDHDGVCVAAVSVSGPSTRIGRITARKYAPAVTAAAREIGSALGVTEDAPNRQPAARRTR